ncbi:MAG: 23S rRNA (uridine(2552)-2'-O)-methyltransferase RlmE [Gammaproteobacteria bacterium]|nr:23S rRNA (uridine(2552)-2'-O)-methyltransferase RlmE [Gammaproteobacteria bacterium]
MARTKSSRAWLAEHFTDEYVRRAQQEGFRSRAVYKLQEIDHRDHLLRPGMVVVDLGAAPGGWSQYAARRVGVAGRVVALDVLPMESVAAVDVLQGDFTEKAVLERLLEHLQGRPVDLVISDMAPNISGIDTADQARAMYLAELALDFAVQVLRPGGDFLVKAFQGSGYPEFHQAMRGRFGRVLVRKPRASRARSREIYLVGKGFRSGN